MLTTLDHLVIAVRDLAAAADVYARLLGRRPSWRGWHPTYGTANTLFRLENVYVELLTPRRPGPMSDRLAAWLGEHGEGLFALAFGTEDAEACARALRARGIDAADPIEGVGSEERTGVERRWRSVMLPEAQTLGVRVFAVEHLSPPARLPLAEPVEEARSAVSGCDHVVVNTRNPDRALSFYGSTLGLRLALDRRFPDWGARLLFFRVGGITVEIAAPLEAGDLSGEDRLWGISYRVPDVEAARARLAREGFDVSDVRPGRKPATHVCTVRGEPCGVATLLLARD
ncbi:MAG TPA: VOC family protein [Candidatus Binatia bacterium]|nr:VOC family protein [Candidatus Binatia bacterium]